MGNKNALLLGLASLSFLLLNSPNGDVVTTSGCIPFASGPQITEWEKTNKDLLGIRANDPIAGTPLRNSQDDGTWKMLFKDKTNFAGVFNRYGTYNEDDGTDWNFMIEPFSDYKFVYEKAFENPSKNVGDWPKCIDYSKQENCAAADYNKEKMCMWAEIAPYERFVNSNKWFKKTNNHCKQGEFLKRGDTLAVYGFPVSDDEHGYNPEIHPAQQIWFRHKEKTNNEKKSYFLMFIQDASARFGTWVSSPIFGQFLVAFKVNPSSINPNFSTPLTMNISIAHRDDLITQSSSLFSQDCDDGFSHSLVVDGKKLVTVNEEQGNANNKGLGIQFTEVTKLRDGTIQGYVQISMVLGDYHTAEIGVCVLELEVIKPQFRVVRNENKTDTKQKNN